MKNITSYERQQKYNRAKSLVRQRQTAAQVAVDAAAILSDGDLHPFERTLVTVIVTARQLIEGEATADDLAIALRAWDIVTSKMLAQVRR